MSVIAYIRFSTSHQDERQQLNTIQNYVNSKGMRIDKTYSDEGVSGGTSYQERNLFELLNNLEKGDTLILSEISRLSRSGIKEVSDIMQLYFKPNKLRLIVCNEGLDIDCSDIDNNPMAELQISMLSIFAKMERQLLRKRISSRHEVNKKSIAEKGHFFNKEGMKFSSYAEAYGRKTGTTHAQSCAKARAVCAKNKREKAKANENNKNFLNALSLYEARNGRITVNTDITPFTAELNLLGFKTATGLPFDNKRCRAMLQKVRKIFA